jgi:hypothetical protein
MRAPIQIAALQVAGNRPETICRRRDYRNEAVSRLNSPGPTCSIHRVRLAQFTAVTREAYSHEVSSAGFWPGNDAFPQAAFYSYAYPEPAGFRDQPVTADAHFAAMLGEFILPYDAVRGATEPDALLLDFLSTTYAAAAEAGGWDRAALECPIGVPGQVRRV